MDGTEGIIVSSGNYSIQKPGTSLLDEPEISMSSVPESDASTSSKQTPTPTTSRVRNREPTTSSSSKQTPKKYTAFEQHIIKRDIKLSKKMNSLISVFGQVVSHQFPHINVDCLIVASSSDSE